MTRDDIQRKVDQISDVAIIVFTDGERHITMCRTIQVGEETLKYIDVHCKPDSAPIEVPYSVVADVQDYNPFG